MAKDGKTKAIYKDGQRARRKGKDRRDNPYAPGKKPLKAYTWDKGWRDENAIIKALSPESGWKQGGEHV